jgi:pilus assembly protein Flp/PilA
MFKKFLRDESGTTTIEYALIAVLVSIAILGSLLAFGASLDNIYGAVGSQVSGAASLVALR